MLIVVILVGLLYALPNIYGEDPAVQITGARGVAASETTLDQVRTVLEKDNIASKSIALENGAILARFKDPDVQLRAREALVTELGDKFVVALNLAPATPTWLAMMHARSQRIDALTERFIRAMDEDLDKLGVLKPDHEPRATQYLPAIISMVAQLIERGFAYVAPNKDVMYAVAQFDGYGKLSGKKLQDLRAGARVDRIAAVTTSSLPALTSYLTGERAFRAGEYVVAAQKFDSHEMVEVRHTLAAGEQYSTIWDFERLIRGQRDVGLREQRRFRLGARCRNLRERAPRRGDVAPIGFRQGESERRFDVAGLPHDRERVPARRFVEAPQVARCLARGCEHVRGRRAEVEQCRVREDGVVAFGPAEHDGLVVEQPSVVGRRRTQGAQEAECFVVAARARERRRASRFCLGGRRGRLRRQCRCE